MTEPEQMSKREIPAVFKEPPLEDREGSDPQAMLGFVVAVLFLALGVAVGLAVWAVVV